MLIPGLTGLLLLTTACSGQPTTTPADSSTPATAGSAATGSGLSSVLLVGDSVAAGEAVPLTAAFAASKVHFQSLAADGGGNVVGPFSDKTWPELSQQITSAKPSVVIYQITTYDWGNQQQQQRAYQRLLATVTGTGAKLAFVSMPPIKPDDFYRAHLADLNRTTSVAQTVAQASSGQATLLDAGAVWGPTYQQRKDGKPDRSADGIHTCPQGAARFTVWLLRELARMFPGFTPADPHAWANTGWSASKRFVGCS